MQLRPCCGCARGAPLRAFGSRRFRSWCHPPPRLAGPPGTRCGRKADERLFLVCRQSGRLSAAVAPQPLPLVGPPCSARVPGIGERAAVPAGLKRPMWQVARLRPRSLVCWGTRLRARTPAEGGALSSRRSLRAWVRLRALASPCSALRRRHRLRGSFMPLFADLLAGSSDASFKGQLRPNIDILTRSRAGQEASQLPAAAPAVRSGSSPRCWQLRLHPSSRSRGDPACGPGRPGKETEPRNPLTNPGSISGAAQARRRRCS